MTGGKNGLPAVQNLEHRRSQRVFETNAELELTKCPAHPTKRVWTSHLDAIREAEVRSTAAKMQIVAYRCDDCGNAHLCKATNARPGSILEREPFTGPELPVVPGNTEARRKTLAAFLADRESASTDELCELLDISRAAVGKLMLEFEWHNTRGRFAKWIPNSASPQGRAPSALRAVDNPVDKPVELAMRRHPAAQVVGWEPMLALDAIRHIPLGDLIDVLAAQGREIRIQTRERP